MEKITCNRFYKQSVITRLFLYLLSGSMFFATISIFHVNSFNIRFWQIFLLVYFLFNFLLCYRYCFLLTLNKYQYFFASLIFLLFFLLLISGFNALDGFLFIKQISLIAIMFLLFFAMTFLRDINVILYLIKVIGIIGTLVCLYSIWELFYNHANLPKYYFNGIYLPRARGFFVEPNEFSQYMTLPFSFVLSHFLMVKSKKIVNFSLFVMLIILITGQLFSFSRGGLISYFASIFIILFFNRKLFIKNKSIKYLVLSLFITSFLYIFSGSVFFSALIERLIGLFSGSDATAVIRYDAIINALSFQSEDPFYILFGIGFGNLPVLLGSDVATTSNFIIDYYVESGLFSIFILLFFILYLLRISFSQLTILYDDMPYDLRAGFVGVLASFCGVLAGGLTYATHMLNIFWFTAGLLVAFICFFKSPRYESRGIL